MLKESTINVSLKKNITDCVSVSLTWGNFSIERALGNWVYSVQYQEDLQRLVRKLGRGISKYNPSVVLIFIFVEHLNIALKNFFDRWNEGT